MRPSRSLLTLLDRASRNFIWTGDIKLQGRCVINWDRMCAHKEAGGMELSSFSINNDSLLWSLAWNFMTSNNVVFNICRTRYLASDLCFLNRIASSSIWSPLRGIINRLSDNVRCIVGTGSSIDFWQDDWHGYRLVDKLNLPEGMRHLLLDRVSDFLQEGVWQFSSKFLVRFPDLVWDIIQVPILQNARDERFWTRSVKGQVTAAVARLSLRPSFPEVSRGSWIWDNKIPVRRSLLLLRLCHSRLPTTLMLRSFGIHGPSICW